MGSDTVLPSAPALVSTGEAPSELACTNEDGLEEMTEEDLRKHIAARGIAVPEGGGRYSYPSILQCVAVGVCRAHTVPPHAHTAEFLLDVQWWLTTTVRP